MRRIPMYLIDDTGEPVLGLVFSSGDVQISKDQGAYADSVNMPVEIGAGAYYLDIDTTEIGAVGSTVKVNGIGALEFDAYVPAVEHADLAPNEPTASLRRFPVSMVDAASGDPITGATFTGDQMQISKNGAAWVDGDGVVREIGLGSYYYEALVGEIDTVGIFLVKITETSALPFVVTLTIGASSTLVVSNFVPAENVTPGDAGGFSISFKTARVTPIEFDLTGVDISLPVTITVAYANRNEAYTAREADGVMRWPFDIEPDNSIGDLSSEPVHVTMLPRGGWPPCDVEIKVSQGSMAVT